MVAIPCGFKSRLRHQHKGTGFTCPLVLVFKLVRDLNRLVSATEKANVICKGRRQKVGIHLLRPRRDSERISARICKNIIFAKTQFCVFGEAEQVPPSASAKGIALLFQSPARTKLVLTGDFDFVLCD